MRKLEIANLANGLSAPNFKAVKTHVRYLAERIHDQIKTEVRDTFIFVMVDAATKFRRSILGVNIQYIYEGRVVLRCVGMINLTASHTTAYLTEEILNRLNSFGIENRQIISITTDNAPAMLAIPDLMNSGCSDFEDLERNRENGDDVDDALQKNMRRFFTLDSEDEEKLSCDEDVSDDIERNALLADLLNDSEVFRTTLQELKDRFNTRTMNVKGVRCGVHFLQLAVKDSLKNSSDGYIIAVCRNVCKLLRKP